jgi:hypothetical protein
LVGGELGRMVSKKKTTKKDAEPAEEVKADEEPKLAVVDEESTAEVVLKAIPEDAEEIPVPTSGVIVEKTKDPIEEPKVAFVDETTKLLNLLGEAPPIPLILSIEDAVKFVDRYRVWKLKVKAETG